MSELVFLVLAAPFFVGVLHQIMTEPRIIKILAYLFFLLLLGYIMIAFSCVLSVKMLEDTFRSPRSCIKLPRIRVLMSRDFRAYVA